MARRIRRLPRCQLRGCSEPVGRAVRIELPVPPLDLGLGDQAPARVYVGLCPRCSREVEHRARLMREAYEELEELLREAEGALAHQRARAMRAEWELSVLERALFWLLRAVGSEVADEADVRLGLGLPA